MRLIYADYNPLTNSIHVTTFENYILRIDCNKQIGGEAFQRGKCMCYQKIFERYKERIAEEK